MGLVNAVYNWPTVKALYYTTFSMNLAGLVAMVLAISWAVRFERGFGDYLNLLDPGDGHVWTAMIIFAAVSCSPSYFLGMKCWLYLKFKPMKSDPEDRNNVQDNVHSRDVNRFLFFHVIACLSSGFFVAILDATYLILLSGFQQKNRDGLIEAIEKYSSDIAVKARIDAVQSELECCGDNSYEDWFHVPWLKLSMEEPEVVENGPRLEEQSITEDLEEKPVPVDVPFSCCSNDIQRPCVHHNILSPSTVYDYNPRHLTITTRGCRTVIIDRGEIIGMFLAGYLALLSIYQMALAVMSRLLQTAHSNDLYIGPEKIRYHVWIFCKPEEFNENDEGPRRRSPSRTQPRQNLASTRSSPQFRRSIRGREKVLTNIRSKVTSFKSKSLHIVRPTVNRNNFRRRKGNANELEEDIDDEEQRKLLSNRVTRSEVLMKKDHRSVFSLISSDSSAMDLPPPPPPFPASLEVESEQEKIPVATVSSAALKIEMKNITLNKKSATNLNSGRRIKILEKFGSICEYKDCATQHRERGGADNSSSSKRSSASNPSRKRTGAELNSADTYNRFRGTLQHTLARRETTLARKKSWNVHGQRIQKNLDVRRASVLARLRCNNVPPSYRLLANIKDPSRTDLQEQPEPSTFPSSQPVPPSLPSRQSNLSTRNLTRIDGARQWPRKVRQCSICNRPVRPSSSSSRGSPIDTRENSRTFPTSDGRKDASVAFVSRHRSTHVSKSVNRR